MLNLMLWFIVFFRITLQYLTYLYSILVTEYSSSLHSWIQYLYAVLSTVWGTSATVADGHMIFRRALLPDSGATTAMAVVAASEIPALRVTVV